MVGVKIGISTHIFKKLGEDSEESDSFPHFTPEIYTLLEKREEEIQALYLHLFE